MSWILKLSISALSLFSASCLQAGQDADLVLKKICQGTCSGKMAWVQTWNDAAGQTKAYQYQGSLDACSHPPQIFYRADGTALGSFPEFPVNAQDPASTARLRELEAKREGWLKGLVAGKKIWCNPPIAAPQSH